MGRPKLTPSTKKQTLSVVLDPDQMAVIRREAAIQRTSVSHIIRMALDTTSLFRSIQAADTTDERHVA